MDFVIAGASFPCGAGELGKVASQHGFSPAFIDHPHTAGTGVGQPSVEGGGDAGLGRRGAATAANDSTEPPTEPDDLGSLVILQHARDHCCGVGVEVQAGALL